MRVEMAIPASAQKVFVSLSIRIKHLLEARKVVNWTPNFCTSCIQSAEETDGSEIIFRPLPVIAAHEDP